MLRVRTLLGDLTDAFDDNAWPDDVLHAFGDPSRLDGLASYSFDEVSAMPRKFAKAFLVRDGKTHNSTLKRKHERDYYDEGWTIYWHSVRSPLIDQWVRQLNSELDLVGGATRVSAFASRRGPGLLPHYDVNDNFVCQAAGTKRWRLAPSTVKYPTVGYTTGESPTLKQAAELNGATAPSLDRAIDMLPGDVVFVPRGVWHDTETLSDESLHFNIQCGLATWKDLVEYVALESGAEALTEQMDSIDHIKIDDVQKFISKRRSA